MRSTLTDTNIMQGRRVALVGRLAGMSRREATALVRQQGGEVVDETSPGTDIVVIGEADLPLSDSGELTQLLDEPFRRAAECGRLEVVSESDFWQRLGLLEDRSGLQRLYTPAMLAQLLNVPVAVVRRWHRRGLIRPVQMVRKLPYFDFREVATARRLAELLAGGVSPQQLEKQLAELARWLPGIERPLAQLSVIVEGKSLLLRQGEGLIDARGQRRIDFDSADCDEGPIAAVVVPEALFALPGDVALASADGSPQYLLDLAATLDDGGRLAEAVDAYRAALAAGGPSAEVCFQLAELLYRVGQLPAAIERYYMAIELDEDYVEARARTWGALAETGEGELAAAAFAGALRYHPDYADAHYHLACTLDQLGRGEDAKLHWQSFARLSPESPWADEARCRLEN